MINRAVLLSLVFLSLLFAGGCADDNSAAPALDEAHPQQWIFVHGGEAREDLGACRTCHGGDLLGNGEAVSCFACHFQGAPGFTTFGIHPVGWDNVIVDHQAFPQEFSWTTCANFACHGENLEGGVTGGPSCFLANCHAEGPPAPASHDVPPGESFFEPENHGPLAQNDLIYCRNCHGRPPASFDGGYVADPQIVDVAIGTCSLASCHPTAMAHPADWLQTAGGPVSGDDRAPWYPATHTDIVPTERTVESCQLCHRLPVVGIPVSATSPCAACHSP